MIERISTNILEKSYSKFELPAFAEVFNFTVDTATLKSKTFIKSVPYLWNLFNLKARLSSTFNLRSVTDIALPDFYISKPDVKPHFTTMKFHKTLHLTLTFQESVKSWAHQALFFQFGTRVKSMHWSPCKWQMARRGWCAWLKPSLPWQKAITKVRNCPRYQSKYY